ncbi:ribbon-helix-helix domain-containing protein [Modestobacter roseus]|uniref:Ribbon-helix-helix CopG family protein n=1 Tax=Modestobacter roseus TaxID=1181884 RepID=A0A562IRV0_9ACTN|nr:ribbon-helix-helix domain-containing protein [Modestobacter roseus]MQA35136.1 ribbon-helix-helix protein, CopG family [Modestobacter roseus]TWH73632.1 ribbon-helix-helix CopG family protein [Modestobacter roseus]
MKLSVSLSDADVALLDEYARTSGLKGRSAVIQHALRLLREAELEQDYAAAWGEWETDDATVWDTTVADGPADASR